MGGNVHTTKENTEALLIASKEIGLEVNADETKYMVMSWGQNAGLIQNTETHNNLFERVEEFKYLGTTLTIKIQFRKKLRADWIQGMLAIIWCRTFRFQFAIQKHKD